LEHAKGCSVEGCPLESVAFGSAGDLFFTLLEHDHVEGFDAASGGKVGEVTHLRGAARSAEVPKTRCLCAWHHFERTARQRGFRTVDKLPNPKQRVLGAWKQRVGCQHPHHSSMKFASMVPDASEGVALGFFDVSHKLRTPLRHLSESDRLDQYMRDLHSGDAVVMCTFCHLMYTLCEDAMMYTSALTVHQIAILRDRWPAFFQSFAEWTAGFDWDAERLRIRIKLSNSHKRPRAASVSPDECSDPE